MPEWEQLTWGDVATLEYGRALRGYENAAGTVRVFGTNGPIGWTSEAQAEGPGVVLGRKGAYRGVHYSDGPFWVIDTAYFLRANRKLDMRWAYYALKVQDINAMDSGSAIPSTSRADFYSLRIAVPPLAEQQAVAAALGALDDKIAINDRTAEAADVLALAAYNEVVAECGHMSTVGDVAAFHNKRRVPLSSRQRSNFPGAYPYYGANGVLDSVSEYIFDGSYVLVGEDGTVIVDERRPVVQYVQGKFWVNNHAHVLTGTRLSNELLVVALRRSDVRPYVTGAVQPKLSMGNLKKLPICLPIVADQAVTEAKLCDLFSLVHAKDVENEALAQLRDTLLPKLMSGEVRVREAEKIVEDAT